MTEAVYADRLESVAVPDVEALVATEVSGDESKIHIIYSRYIDGIKLALQLLNQMIPEMGSLRERMSHKVEEFDALIRIELFAPSAQDIDACRTSIQKFDQRAQALAKFIDWRNTAKVVHEYCRPRIPTEREVESLGAAAKASRLEAIDHTTEIRILEARMSCAINHITSRMRTWSTHRDTLDRKITELTKGPEVVSSSSWFSWGGSKPTPAAEASPGTAAVAVSDAASAGTPPAPPRRDRK